MSDANIKQILTTILDTQDKLTSMIIEMQVELMTLEVVLSGLDSRAAPMLVTQVEIQRKRHHERLEQTLKTISLCRESVSKAVQ